MLVKLAVLGGCFSFTAFGQSGTLIVREFDSLRVEIQELGKAVNGPYSDYGPVITADGLELFFTSRRPETEKEIRRQTEGRERIFHSTQDESSAWKASEPLSATINVSGRYISAVAVSNDGQRLLMYQDDRYGNGDIYESFLKGSEWSAPQPIQAPVNTEAHESSASISPDGRTIYFISDRPGGKGKRDIWSVSKDVSGNWQEPKNLGRTINSTEDEESVYIHPDGRTLYFSSRGHNTIGGFDVFRSVWSEEDGWSDPENLGDPVNSEGDDLFYVLTADGKQAYYTSTRNGGDKNLFSVRYYPLSKTIAEQPKVSILKGIVRDDQTQQPVPATIEVYDNEKNELVGTFTSNEETGKFLISLPSGKNYGISVDAPGYLFYSENVSLSDTSAFSQISRDIRLKKLTAGTQVVLRNIFFDYNSFTLKQESTAELEKVRHLLEGNPDLRIEISGHTDTQGAAAFNFQLSENRARSVVDYLVGAGISPDRLIYKGYGETKPVISDEVIRSLPTRKEQDDAHGQNRRTEFKVL